MAQDVSTAILRAFGQRPVAYYPIFARIMGSASGGLILSQLFYWAAVLSAKQGDVVHFWKTDKEIREETGTAEWEFRKAKEKLSTLSFIQITVEGLPAKTHYTIDLRKLVCEIHALIVSDTTENGGDYTDNHTSEEGESCKLVSDINKTSFENVSKLDLRTSPNLLRDSLKTLQENTTENTTENNKLCANAHNVVGQDSQPKKEKPKQLRLVSPKQPKGSEKEKRNYFREIAQVSRTLGETLDSGDVMALLRFWKRLREGDPPAGVTGLSVEEIMAVCQQAKQHARDESSCNLAYLVRNWSTAKWLAQGAPKGKDLREREEERMQQQYREEILAHIERISMEEEKNNGSFYTV